MTETLLIAFKYASEAGNIELFDVLAKEFDSFTQEDKNQLLEQTVIHSPNTDFISHVLEFGYDLNYKDDADNSLLHLAAMSSYPQTVQFFISKGIDIEAKNSNDETPLFNAATFSDNIEVLKTLLEAGADKNVTSRSGENLLISAAGFNSNPEVIKFLLKMGFDIESRDEDGFTPLLYAALYQSNYDIIETLVDAGGDVKAKTNMGDNILHMAAQNECTDMVYFLRSWFLTSDTNSAGESCFENALKCSTSPEVINILLRKMKEEHVMFACTNEKAEILEALINAGYDVNTTDVYGMSALMFAAQVNSRPGIIRMLRYYRADLYAHDNNGRNALHYAAVNTEPAIYNFMLEDNDFKKLIDEKDDKGNVPEYYKEHPNEF